MKILITGVCGFVGSTLAIMLREALPGVRIVGVDNFSRPGSETNRLALRRLEVQVVAGDIRNASDLDGLPAVDWVIDAAATPSVVAGVTAGSSSRQLVEHNLLGTVNLLEYCKRQRAGFLLLSTSRVYNIPRLAALPVQVVNQAFTLDADACCLMGVSSEGVAESFSTDAPVSLYGSTKLASECLALEYGAAFDFPVWINRCGVLAGAGQFGRPDQGIFAYWIHSYKSQRPLKYLGFGGNGYQVRDCLHPRDLVSLILKQMLAPDHVAQRIANVAGGAAAAMSLRQLSNWCRNRFGPSTIESSLETRPFDIPWVVLDARQAQQEWSWRPQIELEAILEEIANHAETHPDWLELSAV